METDWRKDIVHFYSKTFGLESDEIIKSVIQIVKKHTAVSVLQSNRRRRVEYNNLGNGGDGWEAHKFYVNSFSRFKVEDHDISDNWE